MLVYVALMSLCAGLVASMPQRGGQGGTAAGGGSASGTGLVSQCDPSGLDNGIPAGSALTPTPDPATQPLLFVAVGVGSQNYTCDGAAYTSVGAVATLSDASCDASPDVDAGGLAKLGDHYFLTTSAGLSGVFDMRARGGADAFVIIKKTGSIAAPDAANDVPWLSLVVDTSVADAGSLAQTVYRLQTEGGQPPATCDASSPPVQIPYRALYWFYGAATTQAATTAAAPAPVEAVVTTAAAAGRPARGGGGGGGGPRFRRALRKTHLAV